MIRAKALHHAAVIVSDLEIAKAFYRDVCGTRSIDTRDAHLALRVASFNETVAHLEEMGVECVARPDSITGWGQIYVCDPDGNVIELNAEQGS